MQKQPEQGNRVTTRANSAGGEGGPPRGSQKHLHARQNLDTPKKTRTNAARGENKRPKACPILKVKPTPAKRHPQSTRTNAARRENEHPKARQTNQTPRSNARQRNRRPQSTRTNAAGGENEHPKACQTDQTPRSNARHRKDAHKAHAPPPPEAKTSIQRHAKPPKRQGLNAVRR